MRHFHLCPAWSNAKVAAISTLADVRCKLLDSFSHWAKNTYFNIVFLAGWLGTTFVDWIPTILQIIGIVSGVALAIYHIQNTRLANANLRKTRMEIAKLEQEQEEREREKNQL